MRKYSRQDRLDGCETGADDRNVDLGHGPAPDDNGSAVGDGYTIYELDGPYDGDDAHTGDEVAESATERIQTEAKS